MLNKRRLSGDAALAVDQSERAGGAARGATGQLGLLEGEENRTRDGTLTSEGENPSKT